jgi:hypothetical protein
LKNKRQFFSGLLADFALPKMISSRSRAKCGSCVAKQATIFFWASCGLCVAENDFLAKQGEMRLVRGQRQEDQVGVQAIQQVARIRVVPARQLHRPDVAHDLVLGLPRDLCKKIT